MKELFLQIFARLLAAPAIRVDELGDRLVKHTDRYNAQPEFMDGGVPFHLPAVFVELGRVAWKSYPQGVQRGEAVIRLHIVQYTAADSYMNTAGGSENQAGALMMVDVIDLVHSHIQGLSFSTPQLSCAPLDRIATLSDTRHDLVSVDILEYRALLTQEILHPDEQYAVITAFNPAGEIDFPGPPVAGDE